MQIFHRKSTNIKSETVAYKVEPSRLEQLCGGDTDLEDALEHFLLLDPERQIPQLGETNTFIACGNEARAKGEKWEALVNYEIAARIEVPRGNKEKVEKCLILARDVSERGPERARIEKLLEDLDRVISIANQFYAPPRRRSGGLESEQEPNVESRCCYLFG